MKQKTYIEFLKLGRPLVVFWIVVANCTMFSSGMKYQIIRQPKTWNDAKKYCEDNHAKLATLLTGAEVKEAANFITDGAYYWIGGRCKYCDKTNVDDVSKWIWIGEKEIQLTSTFWGYRSGRRMPCYHGQSGYYLAINWQRKGDVSSFANLDNGSKFKFICQNNRGDDVTTSSSPPPTITTSPPSKLMTTPLLLPTATSTTTTTKTATKTKKDENTITNLKPKKTYKENAALGATNTEATTFTPAVVTTKTHAIETTGATAERATETSATLTPPESRWTWVAVVVITVVMLIAVVWVHCVYKTRRKRLLRAEAAAAANANAAAVVPAATEAAVLSRSATDSNWTRNYSSSTPPLDDSSESYASSYYTRTGTTAETTSTYTTPTATTASSSSSSS